ncbi:iron-containing alcohol dehydrogenase [candidate division WOR-3 bacterium]|nr:iron-containing alcohol dehydrogenase [candidate division WOR-3 bacterium]
MRKIADLAAILAHHRVKLETVLILCDENTAEIAGNAVISALREAEAVTCRYFVVNSDDRNVRDVMQAIRKQRPGLVIGVGGGKVLDVAKLAAARTATMFISIPTTLSNDGIASPVAVIKDRQNIPVSHITLPPFGVIIDIDIVKRAPRRHLIAGVGDLISNLSAVFDARLAHEKQGEKISTHALELAGSGGKHLLDLPESAVEDPAFLRELAHGLIRSGFAMCLCGTSRPASGSEHKISHSIDHLFPSSNGLHGEQAGIATLFTMALQHNERLESVRAFYEKIGFPGKLDYLNLSRADFVRAVLNATRIRPDRFTVLEHKRPARREIEAIIAELSL